MKERPHEADMTKEDARKTSLLSTRMCDEYRDATLAACGDDSADTTAGLVKAIANYSAAAAADFEW